MIQQISRSLWTLPLVALIAGFCAVEAASAATEFGDIPYLQARVGQVLERTPDGGEGDWFNEATGNSGVIRVLRTHYRTPETPCRDYERTTRRPGRPDALVRGTGCRDATGRWRLEEVEPEGAAGRQGGGQATQSGAWPPPGSEATSQPQQLLKPPASESWAPESRAPESSAPAAPAKAARAPDPSPADEIPIVMPTPSE